jgi:putative transcriptional regulator
MSSSKKPSSDPSPLAGTLLLASPVMDDPNFARTVIFMAAHNQKDGAFGYILNRPLEQQVGDLLPDQDLGPLGEVPVFMGGPVATDKLAFAALHWNKRKSTLRCQTHLSVPDALKALKLGHEVRGFVGYTGWTGGQLENEIQRRSWITAKARPLVLTLATPEDLWGAILHDMGPTFGLMAGVPEKVRWN